ncbi:sensory box histidine kinase/response regulator [Roseibacterium elongatum DSM 19469]|uniref:histidine kinase n=2 Tax=Roseicyclus elongatus TaxID=159346 RepID=W8S513_9RHOB|nr:sensory box histidine kinase/response regulator [Roseibacterium elongatum DSM 19469]
MEAEGSDKAQGGRLAARPADGPRPRRLAGPVVGIARQPALILVLGCIAAVAAWLAPRAAQQFALLAVAGGLFSVSAVLLIHDAFLRYRRRSDLRLAMRLSQHDPSPCVLADPSGAIVIGNPAAERRLALRVGQPVAQAVTALVPNASAVTFRLVSGLARRPSCSETVITPRGPVRLSVQQVPGGALWRVDDLAETATRAGAGIGLPMMIVSQNDTILTMNEAMREVLGARATRLEDLFPALPLVAGRRTRMRGAEGLIEVIPIVVNARDGRREIYTVPGLAEPPAASVAARAFEALPVALLHIGSEGQVLAWNPHAQTLLGVSPQDLGPLSHFVEGLGRPVQDWVSDTLAERVKPRPEVVRARRRDDECFLQISLSRITDATGPSLLAVLHDATELKTLEQQFVQSQKMQAIGELAGGIAHDFNNLLTAITGYCDLLLLRHDQGDPDYGDLVQINQNANRAASLVGQLLAFSRKQTLEPEVLDLRDTMGELTHLLNRLVGEKVTLTLSHDPGLLPVRVDRRQLDQVLMNLVVNARDAMAEGGEIRVETRVVRLGEPLHRDQAIVPIGQYVTIRVRDQGHGIPPDKLDRIFEPFFTTKRVGEGTGLGLSMAYGIIKQTGGYIFVDSVVNAGTTFTIYIPAYDLPDSAASAVPEPDSAERIAERLAAETAAAAPRIAPPAHDDAPHADAPDDPACDRPAPQPSQPAAEAQASPPPPAAPAQSDPGDRVVLLVEDEAPVRAFASRALRLRGYTVLEAESAEDALAVLDRTEHEIDLFVTDVVMPGRDGPSWVREALGAYPDVKVVFVSGYSEDAIDEMSMGIPNSVFLPKPFTLSELTETVRRQLP